VKTRPVLAGFLVITSSKLFKFVGDAKNVNTALKAKAKAWTFKAKAIGSEAKAIKFGLEAEAWPPGLHHCVTFTC